MRLRMIVIGGCCLIGIAVWPLRAPTEGKKLSFTGSIEEKTCTISPQEVPALTSSGVFRARRMACPKAGEATLPSPTYLLNRTHLTGVTTDRLLEYFAAYVTADQGDAVLLTQVYD